MSHYTDSFPGREISVEGKNFLYFGGTSYLGLQTNSDFQHLFGQNIRKYGTNYSASRKSNIKLSVFEKAETALATLVGSQACTTLSSGYLACKLVAEHFDNDSFKCFYAPNTHSALFQKGTVLHKSFRGLVQAVNEFIASGQVETPVVFLDSIETVKTSYPNFDGLHKLPLNDVILVVDDSHGIGVLGVNGGGAYQSIKKLNSKELVVCCSLGKGLGIQAGAVLGVKERIDELMSTNLFGGASPATPAALATFSQGESIYKDSHEKLLENIALFLKETETLEKFHFIQGHPVFTFMDDKLSIYLESNGILTTYFKYPDKYGELVSRIVISAAHTAEDIKFLSQILNSYKNHNIKIN